MSLYTAWFVFAWHNNIREVPLNKVKEKWFMICNARNCIISIQSSKMHGRLSGSIPLVLIHLPLSAENLWQFCYGRHNKKRKRTLIEILMLEEFLNRIIHGDCLDVLHQLPDACIDLVVTSPPYNLKNSTGNGKKDDRGGKWANAALVKGYENYDDCMPVEEYAKCA